MYEHYNIERDNENAILLLPEKVILPHSLKFKDVLQSVYDEGFKNIILDCSRLRLFDTAGLSGVAVYQKKFRERGGALKIVNVGDNYIKHLFNTIELNKIVSIEEI